MYLARGRAATVRLGSFEFDGDALDTRGRVPVQIGHGLREALEQGWLRGGMVISFKVTIVQIRLHNLSGHLSDVPKTPKMSAWVHRGPTH